MTWYASFEWYSFKKKNVTDTVSRLSAAKIFSIWRLDDKKNALSITLSIDSDISSSRKGSQVLLPFFRADQREGERGRGKGSREGTTRRVESGCIGTSLSGSWRPSCGSCLAGRLFPGMRVRTGQEESSASNITPPAARRNVRTCDLSRNLARRTRRVLVSLLERERGREGEGRRERNFHGGATLFWGQFATLHRGREVSGRGGREPNKRRDRKTNFGMNRPRGIHSIYFASCPPPLLLFLCLSLSLFLFRALFRRNSGIPTDGTRVFEDVLDLFPSIADRSRSNFSETSYRALSSIKGWSLRFVASD